MSAYWGYHLMLDVHGCNVGLQDVLVEPCCQLSEDFVMLYTWLPK